MPTEIVATITFVRHSCSDQKAPSTCTGILYWYSVHSLILTGDIENQFIVTLVKLESFLELYV